MFLESNRHRESSESVSLSTQSEPGGKKNKKHKKHKHKKKNKKNPTNGNGCDQISKSVSMSESNFHRG